jgi:hypothetical protein
VGLLEGLGCDVGPETQGCPLAVCHIGIPSLVVRLVRRTTKQDTKTCMLGDNAGDAHYCYGCYRGTCLPPLELVIQGEARLTAHRLESGMLVLPSPHSRAQQYIDAVS